MEQQLEFGITLVREGVNIIHVTKDTSIPEFREDCVYIERDKIKSCPDEDRIMSAIQKKITRSDLFKSKRYTLGLCILILCSKGYCIISPNLNDIDNTFIERCWECIHVVSHNIPNEASEWIKSCMEERLPSSFSALFCQIKNQSSPAVYVGKKLQPTSNLQCVDDEDFNIPKEVWHRDDSIYRTMISHILSRNIKIPNDTERS